MLSAGIAVINVNENIASGLCSFKVTSCIIICIWKILD
jgi:hypothetical protein